MSGASFPGAHFATRHTSLTQWQHRPGAGPGSGWRLVIYNDAMHLADVDWPARIPWDDLGVRRRSRG